MAVNEQLEAVFVHLDEIAAALRGAQLTPERAAALAERADEHIYFAWLRLGGEHRDHPPDCPDCPQFAFDFARDEAEYRALAGEA